MGLVEKLKNQDWFGITTRAIAISVAYAFGEYSESVADFYREKQNFF